MNVGKEDLREFANFTLFNPNFIGYLCRLIAFNLVIGSTQIHRQDEKSDGLGIDNFLLF
ncbi:MAG: hypothetical protein SWJ54_13275 [Cyanobacteriota bacterium]|nr:hypothetical protein [Cyanobacteriota bacterium]